MMIQDDLRGLLALLLEVKEKCPVSGGYYRLFRLPLVIYGLSYLIDDIACIARNQQPGGEDVEELLALAAPLRTKL